MDHNTYPMNNHRNVSVPDICVKELLRHPAYAYVLREAFKIKQAENGL